MSPKKQDAAAPAGLIMGRPTAPSSLLRHATNIVVLALAVSIAIHIGSTVYLSKPPTWPTPSGLVTDQTVGLVATLHSANTQVLRGLVVFFVLGFALLSIARGLNLAGVRSGHSTTGASAEHAGRWLGLGVQILVVSIACLLVAWAWN